MSEPKPYQVQAFLESLIENQIEHQLATGLGRSGLSGGLNGKMFTLQWSEDMPEGLTMDDWLLVDQDGIQWVLETQVYLSKYHPPKPPVNADTQDPLPLEYDPQREGE